MSHTRMCKKHIIMCKVRLHAFNSLSVHVVIMCMFCVICPSYTM